MKILKKMKDGGPESTVTGYWLIESKKLFSIALLKFEGKSRECFHNHAFSCFSWILKGQLVERFLDGSIRLHRRRFLPFVTRREDFHKVDSNGTTWLLTFRGPWSKTWKEYMPDADKFRTLANGRKIV